MEISIIINIGVTLFLVGLSYGMLQAKTSENAKSIEHMKAQQTSLTADIKILSVDLVKAETNLDENYKKVEKLENKIDRVLDTLNELNVSVGRLLGK